MQLVAARAAAAMANTGADGEWCRTSGGDVCGGDDGAESDCAPRRVCVHCVHLCSSVHVM